MAAPSARGTFGIPAGFVPVCFDRAMIARDIPPSTADRFDARRFGFLELSTTGCAPPPRLLQADSLRGERGIDSACGPDYNPDQAPRGVGAPAAMKESPAQYVWRPTRNVEVRRPPSLTDVALTSKSMALNLAAGAGEISPCPVERSIPDCQARVAYAVARPLESPDHRGGSREIRECLQLVEPGRRRQGAGKRVYAREVAEIVLEPTRMHIFG